MPVTNAITYVNWYLDSKVRYVTICLFVCLFFNYSKELVV